MEQENSTINRQKGAHITYEERRVIERCFINRYKQATIAILIGCNKSVISRERKRGLVENTNSDLTKKMVYNADVAQRKYDGHKELKGPGLKIGSDMELATKISEKIKNEHKSPDVIIHELKNEYPETLPCTKTLYSYIDKGDIIPNVTNADLWEKTLRKPRKKGKKNKKRCKKAVAPRKRLSERPREVEGRDEPGHWELDLVVGGKHMSSAVLMTIVERKTRFAIVMRLTDKTQDSVLKAFKKLERGMTPKMFKRIFKTITTDNGSEFLNWPAIESSDFLKGKRTTVYFADPYASWQKGTNENFNRMVRRFIKKGSDIGNYTKSHITESIAWLNDYSRKIISYQTPKDCFEKEFNLSSDFFIKSCC